MTAADLVWTCAPTLGAFIGSLLGALILLRWQRRASPEPTEPADPDRDAVEAVFATHASAVAQQVTIFADGLADGDPVLRERLRRLEQQIGRGHQ